MTPARPEMSLSGAEDRNPTAAQPGSTLVHLAAADRYAIAHAGDEGARGVQHSQISASVARREAERPDHLAELTLGIPKRDSRLLIEHERPLDDRGWTSDRRARL